MQTLSINVSVRARSHLYETQQWCHMCVSVFLRTGELLRGQPAPPGGQSCRAGRAGANRPPDPGGDQPQGDAVQHLSVMITRAPAPG